MGLVLVDTSVWIGFFNNEEHAEVDHLSELLDKGKAVCICPTVIQEILQGINEPAYFNEIKEHLLRQIMLVCEPVEAAIRSAEMYQQLRRKGITIRRSNDCLIAYHALQHEASILHRDRDFENIAKHTELRLFS